MAKLKFHAFLQTVTFSFNVKNTIKGGDLDDNKNHKLQPLKHLKFEFYYLFLI